MHGSLEDVNAALLEGLLYRPPKNYNSKLFGELLLVEANQLDDEPVVSLFLPIVVLPVNDPAEIISPIFHRIALAGFHLKDSYALFSGLNNNYLIISITAEQSVVALYGLTTDLLNRVVFVTGQPEVLGKSCEVLGSYADIEAILRYGSVVCINNVNAEQGKSDSILYIGLSDASSGFLGHQSVVEISISAKGKVKLPALNEVTLLEDAGQPNTAVLVLQVDVNLLDNSSNITCQISGNDLSSYPAERLNSTHIQCSVNWEDLVAGIKSFPIPNTGGSAGGGFAFVFLSETDPGRWSSAGQVYIPKVPVITDLAPRFGSTCGGTSLSVSGGEFQSDADMVCCFSCANSEEEEGDLGHPAVDCKHRDTAQWVSTDSVQCVTPQQATVNCTSLIISLRTSGRGSSATDIGYFEYVSPPFPIAASPLYGPASGGTLVEIEGKGMSSAKYCALGGASVPVEYVSSNLIRCVAPPATDAMRGLSAVHTITTNTLNGQLGVFSGSGTALLPFISIVPGEIVWFEIDIWAVPRVIAESLSELQNLQDPWGQWTTQLTNGGNRAVWSVLVPSIDDMNYSLTSMEHFLWLNLNGTDFGPLPIVFMSKHNPEFVPLTIVTTGSESCSIPDPDHHLPMAFIFRFSWASVEAVEPAVGSVAGGTVLHIFGGGFEDTVNIKCMFMPLSSFANDAVGAQPTLVSHSFTFISPAEALCVSPPSLEKGSFELQV